MSNENLHFKMELSVADDYFELGYRNELSKLELGSLKTWHRLSNGANCCVDVGSYLGLYTAVAARQGGAKVTVSLEPNPVAYSKLLRNLDRNKASGFIAARNVAAGKLNGEVDLIWPRNRRLSSSVQIFSPDEVPKLVGSWVKGPTVRIETLDSMLVDYGKIDLIKIDVEGFEKDVLDGALGVLNDFRPHLIVEILTLERYVFLGSMLKSLGYDSPIPLDGEALNISMPNATLFPGLTFNYLFSPKY
jgi:FkbM family methyltransferase